MKNMNKNNEREYHTSSRTKSINKNNIREYHTSSRIKNKIIEMKESDFESKEK